VVAVVYRLYTKIRTFVHSLTHLDAYTTIESHAAKINLKQKKHANKLYGCSNEIGKTIIEQQQNNNINLQGALKGVDMSGVVDSTKPQKNNNGKKWGGCNNSE